MELLFLVLALAVLFIWLWTRTKRPIEAPIPKSLEAVVALSSADTNKIIDTFPLAFVKLVKDGDTVNVVVEQTQFTVRLDSIDCPEDGQHWGDTARYGLIKLIGGQNVRLEVHGVDIHGRTLATIYVKPSLAEPWINVNERMVMLGHAWVMHTFYGHLPQDRKDTLNRLERWARTKKVGLWRGSNPVPPWKWRNGAKPQN